MVLLRRSLVLVALTLLAACAPPTGSLVVTVGGLPAGADAAVTVTGPGSYRTTVTETASLSGLAPGSYTLFADTVTATAVTSAYEATVTPSTVAVAAGEAAVATVTYTLQGGSLAISVSGLPLGVDADVRIAGPESFGQDLTASTVLTDLTPGAYDASAESVSDGSNTFTPTITGSPAEVSSSELASIEIAYARDPGSLAVTIEGLPSGLDAEVSVAGPDGFDRELSASALLTDLTPGVYSATANPVSSGIQTYAATISGSPTEVTSSTEADIGVAYAVVPGSLDVTIEGLPGGVDPDVSVQGPNGYAAVLTASTTLTDLTPGAYRVTPSSVREAHPVVSNLFAADSELVLVASDATATVDVPYAAVPSSGRLWIPYNGATITTGWAADDLLSTGSPAPAATLTGEARFNESIVFDGSGNAWITMQVVSAIARYTAADLAADGSPSPSVVVGGIGNPIGMAFDGSGNLFVASFSNHEVVMFTPDQLQSTGVKTPAVTISAVGSSFDGPIALAFDPEGDLWVANNAGDTVVRLGASQLYATGSPQPETTIADAGGGDLSAPNALAFDASGGLWVTNNTGNQAIVQYEKPQALSGAVTPTPDVVLTSVSLPRGAAFDNSGALWVMSAVTEDLYRFDDPGSLTGSVSPTPDAVIANDTIVNFGQFALFPPAEGLPISIP